MDIKDFYAILEDRYVDLSRLANEDMSISVDWYDGARSELRRTIKLLKRHLSDNSSGCLQLAEEIHEQVHNGASVSDIMHILETHR